MIWFLCRHDTFLRRFLCVQSDFLGLVSMMTMNIDAYLLLLRITSIRFILLLVGCILFGFSYRFMDECSCRSKIYFYFYLMIFSTSLTSLQLGFEIQAINGLFLNPIKTMFVNIFWVLIYLHFTIAICPTTIFLLPSVNESPSFASYCHFDATQGKGWIPKGDVLAPSNTTT